MNGFDAEFSMDTQNILRPQVVTASGTGADTPQTVDMEGTARAIFFAGDLTAGATITGTIEHAEEHAGPWEALPGGVFAPITEANRGASLSVDLRVCRRLVRLSYVLEGTDPSAVVSAFCFGFRKRPFAP